MGNEIKIEGDLQTIDIDNSSRINRTGIIYNFFKRNRI